MIRLDSIQLRGVNVHNLNSIDLDLIRGRLIVFCGVSGSGKTSLALDTLYAEGQRRYIESFSAYTRQYLERLDKPDAESIDGIPPAIAVTRTQPTSSSRSTVGTATETIEYLRLLYSKAAQASCPECNALIQRDDPASIGRWLSHLPDGTRWMLSFKASRGSSAQDDTELDQREHSTPSWSDYLEQGFVRGIVFDVQEHVTGTVCDLASQDSATPQSESNNRNWSTEILVDRLVAGQSTPERQDSSLESAFVWGDEQCQLYVEADAIERVENNGELPAAGITQRRAEACEIDGRKWLRFTFSKSLSCSACNITLPNPEPRLFSFNSPLGACPTCEGFGTIFRPDMDLVIPDHSKSLRDGAIAVWNTKTYGKELRELLQVAEQVKLPVDIPYRELSEEQRELVRHGIPGTDFVGIDGFFAWLEKRAFKTHHRAFLSRWRSEYRCPGCNGNRLRPAALAFRIGNLNIADICQQETQEAESIMGTWTIAEHLQEIVGNLHQQILRRLRFLIDVGLGYLTLDRPLRTLSGGEAQRVALTTALGSTLVNMLYILDEPTVGLHPVDVARLKEAIFALKNRGNTLVVVEHEPTLIEAADEIVEIGPGAGDAGGSIVFQGRPDELLQSDNSPTADFLCGRRGNSLPQNRRTATHGRIKLVGARGNNLKNLTIEFPLGLMCVVSGVSGSGKSSLVHDTLYGALCRRKRKEGPQPLAFDDVLGDGQIEDIVMIDQSPIGRTPRSNPVTYIKAFDEIRAVFAETLEARTRNFTASHFSFNVDGGRCSKCHGDGYLAIDMQFLADVYMRCPQCKGTRYRKEILDVTYRNRNIAEVLNMTVRKAFAFFRGQVKLQAKLKQLIDVGLDYLKLGQPATTLSSGEAQRLKLASYTGTRKQQRTLFLMDEPTTGLHFSDIVKLIDCFEALLSVGHSLIIVEHNLQLMKAADYIIDLGPGAASAGGTIVAEGTPEEIAACSASQTGTFLKAELAKAHLDD